MNSSPNVLLIILDSCRAKNMSLYGYQRNTTPFLRQFSERSTVYTQARSPGIHSVASHASIFTGLHVEEHNVTDHYDKIDTSKTIWDKLCTEYNYKTGLFTSNGIVSHTSNLGKSFEYRFTPKFETLSDKLPDQVFPDAYYPSKEPKIFGISGHGKRSLQDDAPIRSLLNCAYEQILIGVDNFEAIISSKPTKVECKKESGDTYTNAFFKWMSDQSQPWAACINLMDTHLPYLPLPEYNDFSDKKIDRNSQSEGRLTVDSWTLTNGDGWQQFSALEDLYDGTILQVDSIVKNLIKALEQDSTFDDTLIIVTSDHGEAFGEQSRVDPNVSLSSHNWGIHEVLTHVPLIIKYPEQLSGNTVDDLVTLTDLPVMIESVVGGNTDTDQLVSDDVILSSTERLFEEDVTKHEPHIPDQYIGPYRAVYKNRSNKVRKYIQKRDKYATVDIDDPHNIQLVSQKEHTVVADAYDQLSDRSVLLENTTESNEQLKNHLEDLGYIT